MASILSRLAPVVITLRGSKWRFSRAERTLRQVERLQHHPVPFEPPVSLTRTVSVERRDVNGWPVYTLTAPDEASHRRALYLHGGCYVFEIDRIHWLVAAKLAVETGATVTVPIMPLAPRDTAVNIVPAVADLAERLIAEVGAAGVTIIGDSSCGGMALAVAQVLRDRGHEPLGATVLISPWLDISGTDPRLAQIAPRDPWLAVPGTRAAGALYRGDLDESDPLVSPIHGSLAGLGPITMFSGTRDILNADATRLVALAGAAGVPLEYHEGEGMIHNYPILPMPEGDAARAQIVAAMLR
ncbi:alpha/beta hydrolase fold domain-containing protein [soil metagenome]